MSLSRRRLLSATAGAALVAAAGSGCTDSSPEPAPPTTTPSGAEESMLRDEIADGVAVDDRGFAVFPVPDGDAAKRIVGAAAVFRNTTDQPMRINVRYRFVDETGRGWRSARRNDWAAVASAGWAYLPAGRAVELGDILRVPADEAGRVARIVLAVLGGPARPSTLLSARIAQLRPRPAANDEWDYVSFTVDNPGPDLEEPNYALVYRSGEGALIGGWFVDRANWADIESALPDGETDRYPRGASRHTLPAWLPPAARPNEVTMYLWP